MNKKIKSLFLINIYKVSLIYIYISYLSVAFHYSIFYTINLNYDKVFVSFLTSIFFEIYLLRFFKKCNIENTVIYILYFISYIPMIILFSFKNLSYEVFVLVNLYWLILLISKKIIKIPNIKRLRIKMISKIKILLIIILYGFIVLIFLKNNIKIDLKYFNLYKVYELRRNAENLSVAQNIILFWLGCVINPILALDSVYKKKFFRFCAFFVFQLLIFFLAGHKTQLMLIPAGIIVNIINKKIKKLSDFNLFFCLFALSGIFEKIIFNKEFIQEFLVRRLLFVPALLTEYYFELFKFNRKLYFSEDLIVSRVLKKALGEISYYSKGSSLIVGEKYMSEKTSANVGLLAYGYAEFGILGIVFSAIFFIILLKILDEIFKKNKKNSGFIVMLLVIFSTNIPINFLIYYILIPIILII